MDYYKLHSKLNSNQFLTKSKKKIKDDKFQFTYKTPIQKNLNLVNKNNNSQFNKDEIKKLFTEFYLEKAVLDSTNQKDPLNNFTKDYVGKNDFEQIQQQIKDLFSKSSSHASHLKDINGIILNDIFYQGDPNRYKSNEYGDYENKHAPNKGQHDKDDFNIKRIIKSLLNKYDNAYEKNNNAENYYNMLSDQGKKDIRDYRYASNEGKRALDNFLEKHLKILENTENIENIENPLNIPLENTENTENTEEGKGIFDTIKSVFKTVLPSVKTILKNPKVQKNAIELGSDFIKNKIKPKLQKKVAPTLEQQELEEFFRMFKNKEITAAEYNDLKKSINKDNTKEIIKEMPKEDNLKNLSGQYDPKKIYSDLLAKKLISPEQYLEITTGKKPNLSKPIIHTETIPEVKLDEKGEGINIKKKRKTKPKK